jgi:hypothetical protein
MAAPLSDLAKRIRSSALEEKRSLDDFDRTLNLLGWSDAYSKINLSLGPSKIGLDHLNFFRLDHTKEADRRLKEAFEFCELSHEEPRHWRALLNVLVTECFLKKGRSSTRDKQSLFELLLDIHELQAKNPKLIKAEDIARKLLRSSKFTKKHPSVKKVSSLTRLVRKAQDPKHNPYTRYREDQDIVMSVERDQHLMTGMSGEGFDRALRPVLEIAIALTTQRAQEEILVEMLKSQHLELNGSTCSWEAEQQYRQMAKAAVQKLI